MVTVTTLHAAHVDVPAALDVLADAFATDPAMALALPTAHDRRNRIRAMLAVLLADHHPPGGATDVVHDGDELLAAAAWAAPGRATSGLDELRRLPRLVRALGRDLVPAARFEAHARRHHPRFPHWYLLVIGTRPPAQGTGLGGRLLAHGCARADADATPAYLEASTVRSAALYRRHGFVDLGPLPRGAGTGMWRPATVAVSDG